MLLKTAIIYPQNQNPDCRFLRPFEDLPEVPRPECRWMRGLEALQMPEWGVLHEDCPDTQGRRVSVFHVTWYLSQYFTSISGLNVAPSCVLQINDNTWNANDGLKPIVVSLKAHRF